MSMKRLAVISAVSSSHYSANNNLSATTGNHHNVVDKNHNQTRLNGTQFNGNVNVVLGGWIDFRSVHLTDSVAHKHEFFVTLYITNPENKNTILSAILSLVLTVICFVCYCCHRNLKKRSESVYQQRWLESDPNMEIYSVEQCYDITMGFESSTTADNSPQNSLNNTQLGPPPSYDAVVAMDNAANGIQHLNYKKSSSSLSSLSTSTVIDRCACTSIDRNKNKQKYQQHNESNGCAGDNDDIDSKRNTNCTSDEESMSSAIKSSGSVHKEQILNARDINLRLSSEIRHSSCCCECCEQLSINRQYDIVKLCKRCGRKLKSINGNPYETTNIEYCKCYELSTQNSINNNNNNIPFDDDQCYNNQLSLTNLIQLNTNNDIDNNNLPSTSSQSRTSHYDKNGNDNNNNVAKPRNVVIDFETLNENGLVSLDMSQIIDHTGLPTYEAALKLESSGYV